VPQNGGVSLLCLKMVVSHYCASKWWCLIIVPQNGGVSLLLVLRLIADEQNAHKCGWMEISDIIFFFTFTCLHFVLFYDYFDYVGWCE